MYTDSVPRALILARALSRLLALSLSLLPILSLLFALSRYIRAAHTHQDGKMPLEVAKAQGHGKAAERLQHALDAYYKV